jgi:DNA-binding MarR family transcriptional regulator
MSHVATNWAFKQRGLKPATKMVLLYLADRHNPDYGCFPAQKTLADDCEMSERSVRTHIEELERAGLIVREQITRDGKFASTRYVLQFEVENQRQILPTANPTDGKKCAEPAANIAGHQRQILPTNPVSEPSKKNHVKRQTRIPEDAVISDKQMAAASKRQLSEQEAEAQFEKFKNDALAKGKTFVDWDRAFITWLDSPYFKIITGGRYDQRSANRNGGSQGRENRPDAALEQIARLAGLGASSGNGSF